MCTVFFLIRLHSVSIFCRHRLETGDGVPSYQLLDFSVENMWVTLPKIHAYIGFIPVARRPFF